MLALLYEFYTAFSYEFLCVLYELFTAYFHMNFLCFIQVSLLIFRPYFNINFHCINTNFLLSFVTNRLPYILHCFAFVYELFT